MDAIILAGGAGTRLKAVVSDTQKCMAPVGGRPFLEYVLDKLYLAGIKHIVIAVSFFADAVEKHFGNRYRDITVDYSREDVPMGTGGAISRAIGLCSGSDVLVLNGDTLVDVDFAAFAEFHREMHAPVSVCVKEMENFSRYGAVEINREGRNIVCFHEKKQVERGYINAGVYMVSRSMFELLPTSRFSFEKEVLEAGICLRAAFPVNGYFIDIGIPEDYSRACRELLIRKAAFLDRDGTLNREVNYLHSGAELEFIPGSPEAVAKLNRLGYLVIIITNQAGVAKGRYPESDVTVLHREIDLRLHKYNAFIDAWYYCPHHPDGTVEEFAVSCFCRKPLPGMIQRAVSDFEDRGVSISLPESFLAGDCENDILAGKNGGVGKTVLLLSGHTHDAGGTAADETAENLGAFVKTLT